MNGRHSLPAFRPRAGTEFGLQVGSTTNDLFFCPPLIEGTEKNGDGKYLLQGKSMSKYAFLRSNASLVIVGLIVGLVGGFKFANVQYRKQQSASLNRDIAQATNGMSNPQAEVTAIIDRAKANPNDAEAQIDAAAQFLQIERPQEAMPFLEQARR